jgi:hypothetical protein
MSHWYAKLGFEKAQTDCKFGDFMRYLVHVKGYSEVYIVLPPRLERIVYFINIRNNSNKTYLYHNIEEILETNNKNREEDKQIREAKKKKLPQELNKRFICRYYMAGNCDK